MERRIHIMTTERRTVRVSILEDKRVLAYIELEPHQAESLTGKLFQALVALPVSA